MKKLLSALVLMVLVWGCAKKITPSNSGSQASNNPVMTAAETEAIAAGQTVYKAKCGTCHGLKAVADFTAERWVSIMAVMAPNARLSVTETENVNAYVKANAKK